MMQRRMRALVTGASSGIGLWTARGLAEQGYEVLLVCRDGQRGQAAQHWLQQEVPQAVCEVFLADLALQSEVRRLAALLRDRFGYIDVLMNNAGCFDQQRTVTVDSVATVLAVNYLAPFLLTQLLLPLLQQEGLMTRIINVGSASADYARLDWSALGALQRVSPLKAYAQTKLALLIYSMEQARRLEGTGIVVHCVHPGVVATRIGSVGGVVGWLWWLMTPFLLSAKRGARCSLAVATNLQWQEVTGCYVKRGRSVHMNKQAYDIGIAEELWKLSTDLISRSVDEFGADK
jgi:NAD(P)-dependent dehydrogenase (short-subunit alcohol dehydrogenase family)